MLETHDKMHRVVARLVGRSFRLKIERAKTAVATSGGVKFWIEIKNALGLQIDDTQVGIA